MQSVMISASALRSWVDLGSLHLKFRQIFSLDYKLWMLVIDGVSTAVRILMDSAWTKIRQKSV